MKTAVSEKGQITIPKQLRSQLGIKAGEQLDVTEHDGTLVLRKIRNQNPVDKVYGILKLDRSTDEIMEELRGPVEIP